MTTVEEVRAAMRVADRDQQELGRQLAALRRRIEADKARAEDLQRTIDVLRERLAEWRAAGRTA